MRTIGDNMKAWSLEEVIEQEIGGTGTPARTEFDAVVEKKVRRIEAKRKTKAQKASMHIVVPVHIKDAIRRNAEALGESANAYVNSIFSQAISSYSPA